MTDNLERAKEIANRLHTRANVHTEAGHHTDWGKSLLDAEACILSLIQRVREAEEKAREAEELFATPIGILTDKAWELGRAEGLEEAAKVARRYEELWGPAAGFGDPAVAAKIMAIIYLTHQARHDSMIP